MPPRRMTLVFSVGRWRITYRIKKFSPCPHALGLLLYHLGDPTVLVALVGRVHPGPFLDVGTELVRPGPKHEVSH